MRYVIHKLSRTPRDDSYSGPTWDAAGIRHRYQPTYATHQEAKSLAKVLSAYNPVGFGVSTVTGEKNHG